MYKFVLLIFSIFMVELKFSEGAIVCHNVKVLNSVENFENLRNCTTISGYLKILLIENTTSSAFDNWSFPELTEIRGYFLLYYVSGLKSLDKLFPNLTVIRGLTLFRNYYSFIIYSCDDIINIGLRNLKYIERGASRIGKCPKLCYVHTLDWSKLGHPSHRLYFDNENENCTLNCPNKCKACWNEKTCQITDDENCHPECIGCNGTGANQCRACKLYIDHHTCVSKCPKNKILYAMLGRCITEEECNSSEIPGPWKILDRKCVYNTTRKVCNSTLIDSMDSLKLFKNCTHINGSLSIRVTSLNTEFELSNSLGSIEEVTGYLKIYRSTLVNLDFLKNLSIIHGKELYNQQYSVIVYENPNLQKLWNWNEFGINIKRGNIFFHDNSQLCLKEITSFSTTANISFSEFDVSPYTNGHKQACEFINLNATVQPNATNATLIWNNYTTQSANVSVIGYVVYYIQDSFSNMTIYNERDECENNSWKSAFVTSNNHTLTNLNSYATYAYYVKIYTSSPLEGGRTEINRFKTTTSDPEVVDEMQADSYSSDSITLYWQPPVFSNGKITHHSLVIYAQEDDKEFIAERDYCKFPHVFPRQYILDFPTESTPTPKVDQTDDCCTKTEDNNDWIANFCSKMDLETLSNTKFKPCKDYLYSVKHPKKSKKQDEFVIQNSRSMVKPSYLISEEIIPEGSITSYQVKNLTYFSVYVFYIQACIGSSYCSAAMYASERTMSKLEADDIPPGYSVTVLGNNSFLTWSEPKHPNSVIVSYHIEYKSTGSKNSSNDCITSQQYVLLGFKYTMGNLSIGKYSVRVKAVSLAGPGRFTKFVNFEIRPGSHEMSIELVIILTVVFILLIVSGFFYYRYHNNRKQIRDLDELNLISNSTFDVSGPAYVEDEWEIERDDVEISLELGRGVYSGVIQSKQLPCAVKVGSGVRGNVYEKLSFLNEASFMKSFSTSNHVVKLLGVVSRGAVPMVVVELMARGDLKTYLRQRRRSLNGVTSSEMYRMAAQIADGMMYLKSKKYIHRDLAARNCMVASDHTVKIGNIGMSKDILYEADYYKIKSGGSMPVRWMAPESLTDKVFTSDSDMWSYGIVLWEIVTLAEQPYQELSNEQVLQFVISEGTLKRPPKCPDLLHEIMSVCWKWTPSLRPTFTDVVEKLETHVGQHFRLVSFYHSLEGEEWKLNNKNRMYHPAALPEPFDMNRAVHWDTSFDDISI